MSPVSTTTSTRSLPWTWSSGFSSGLARDATERRMASVRSEYGRAARMRRWARRSLADETIFTVSVLPDGDTWQMWYTHWGAAQNSMVSFATSDCCPSPGPPLENWQFIPAAAVASGAEGSFYQTDVDVNNADSVPVEFQFHWLPRGEDNSEPTASETFSLGAGCSSRRGMTGLGCCSST